MNRFSKPVKITVLVLLVFLCIGLLHSCFKKKPPSIPLPSVLVKKPVWVDRVEYVTQTGTTVAFNSVNLVARIEGYLDAIEFTDGTFIPKGKELFVIQPEPYMEQLKAAQATVAAKKAAYVYAESESKRQQSMYRDHATSLNNVEKWIAKVHESKAEVDKAVADEAIAAINYSYTHVLAPFDGRIGRHLVDVGNLVGKAKDTELATIEQVDKLYVYFNLNEIDLLKLRAAARAHGKNPKNLGEITVEISMQNESDLQYKATLNFMNTGLNAATGTLEFRALLENQKNLFVPGLFVQVRVPITKPNKQLTVPDSAVLYDQIGPYLLVMDSNQMVVLKHVVLGSVDQGMRAIVKGLTAQEDVIVDGLQNASPGHKVLRSAQDDGKAQDDGGKK